MNCIICKNGKTIQGKTTATLTRGGTTIIFHEVPAEICTNCNESYFSEETSEHLLNLAKQAAESGVQIEVRDYLAA